MDSVRKAITSPVTALLTFIERHGSTLPKTVKVEEGFCGTNADDTLEADQILVLYKVERQNMITALDRFNQELCVPRDTTNKVLLLPFEHYSEHSRVHELVNAHQTPYFRVLEDIPSLQICSGTTLKMQSDRPIDNFLKCKPVDLNDDREVQLPLQLAGRYQPLLDPREYYVEEILEQYQLPMNVRFVSQLRANDGVCSRPLSSLGSICLESETEVEMVFAASVDDRLSLNLFPRTLDISVSCGFKVTADTSKKIKACRQTLQTSSKTLKRLDTIASNCCYFTACPLRRFNFEALQLPSISIPKTTGASKALSKAKRCQTIEETSINREAVTKRDHVHCLQSVSKSGFSFEAEPTLYENCDVNDSFDNFDVLKPEVEKGTDAVPPLPPKTYSVSSGSTTADTTTQPRLQSPCPPVPKPRPRTRVARAKKGEKITATQTQSYTGKFIEDDAEETCPELPPRPEFLKASGSNDKGSVTSDEYLSPVSPCSFSEGDADICSEVLLRPEFLTAGGSNDKDDVSSDEYLLLLNPCSSSEDAEICPELPPRPQFLYAGGSNDKTNNALSEEYLSPLTPGSSSEDDAEEIGPELPPRPAFLEANRVEEKEENGVPRDDRPPPLPPRCPGPSDFGFPAYLVVDVADWRAVEEKAFNLTKDDDLYSEAKDDGQVFKQDGPINLDLSLMYPPNDSKTYVAMENPDENEKPYSDKGRPEREEGNEIPYVVMECPGNIGVNVRPKPPDPENSRQVDFIQPDETRASNELAGSPRSQAARENGADAARKFEEESSEDDCHYEEIEKPPSPSKELRGQENAVNQKKTKLQGPSKNLGIKNTHSATSSDARPQHAANASHQRSRSDMIISGRREEDWMDFRDIDQLFKLKKQLADAQKQIIMTKQTITSESHKRQPPASTDSTSDHIENAHHMDTTSACDKNENRPHSPSMFCKPHSQRSTQVAATSSESVLSNRKPVDPQTKVQEKKPSLPFPTPKDIGPEKTTCDRDCSALTRVQERGTVTESDVTNSDNDDDYEECFDRKYVNQQTGIGSSYENMLHSGDADDEIVSVHYLQLENPHEGEDDENVYINFDPQKSDKGLGVKETSAQEESVILEKCCSEEPPPLPPKQQASSQFVTQNDEKPSSLKK